MSKKTLTQRRKDAAERACVHCGCTDSTACFGGCSWIVKHKGVATGVCSACNDASIRIGGFTLQFIGGHLWMTSRIGEGMQLSDAAERRFIRVLNQFFQTEF